jgi:hypothetical protein
VIYLIDGWIPETWLMGVHRGGGSSSQARERLW